ncbi:hypothetical protein Hanom_Chr02g00103111 [Helianthus anomalus]
MLMTLDILLTSRNTLLLKAIPVLIEIGKALLVVLMSFILTMGNY